MINSKCYYRDNTDTYTFDCFLFFSATSRFENHRDLMRTSSKAIMVKQTYNKETQLTNTPEMFSIILGR